MPLFIILSGYLTLGKDVNIKQNLNKIKNRLLIPLISFYIIFNLAYGLMAYLRTEPFDYWGIFHNLSKNTHTTLYFLVVLVLIQLLNPLWNLLTTKQNEALLKYVCKFFLILGAVAYVFYYLSLREGEVFSTFTLWMMWLGYYLYGYIVKIKNPYLTKKETFFYSWMFILGFLLTVVPGFIILWFYHQGISDLFYIGGQSYTDAYLSISVMMMAISGFNLLMRSKIIKNLEEIKIFKKAAVLMASISFALYLVHLLVLDTFSKFFGVTPDSPGMPGLAGYLIISTVLTYLFAIPLAYFLKKIPHIKRIVGE